MEKRHGGSSVGWPKEWTPGGRREGGVSRRAGRAPRSEGVRGRKPTNQVRWGSLAYLFNFAVITPLFISLTPMTPQETFLPGGSDVSDEFLLWHPYCYKRSASSDVDATRMAATTMDQISVIPDFELDQTGEFYQSNSWEVPLRVFLAHLPIGAKEPKPERSRGTAAHHESSHRSRPCKALQSNAAGSAIDQGYRTDSEDSDVNVEELDEEVDKGELWDELEEMRLRWENKEEYRDKDFKVMVLGYEGNIKKKGHVVDAIKGIVKGEEAEKFCTDRKMQKSVRYELGTYGAADAACFARSWCHKMQHFFNFVAGSGDYTRGFSVLERGSYEEPREFIVLADLYSTHRLGKGRVRQIRALFA